MMLRRVLMMAATLAAASILAPSARGSTPRFVGKRIDLELQDAALDAVLRLLADVGDVNIVKQHDVQAGPVTVRFQNIPWDEALYRILRAQGLDMIVDGNVIYVRPEA